MPDSVDYCDLTTIAHYFRRAVLPLVLAALVLLSLYSSLRTVCLLNLRALTRREDKVTAYLERFDAAKHALAGIGEAGYIDDKEAGAYRKLAQYAMPHTVISDGTDCRYVLGNFHSKPAIPRGFRIISSNTAGAVVLKRVSR